MASAKRMDFSIMPGIYRRSYVIPNVLFESGYYPWKCNPEMTHITYRYELEWKDKLYVDVTYHIIDSLRVLVEMKCVNNSDQLQNVLLHNVASLQYDDDCPIVTAKYNDGIMIPACSYANYEPLVRKYNYNLVYNGWLRGQAKDKNSVSGSVLQNFGQNSGDKVTYNVNLPQKLLIDGNTKISLDGYNDYAIKSIDIPSLKDKSKLTFTSLNNQSVTIDAIFVGNNDDITVMEHPRSYRPKVKMLDKGYISEYEDQNNFYGVGWDFTSCDVKTYEGSDLDTFIRENVHKHPPMYFKGDMAGCYTSVFMRPIIVEPKSDVTLYNIIATGTKEQVENAIALFHQKKEKIIASVRTADDTEKEYLQKAENYKFSEQLMQATLLTNVVYPVFTQNENIRHFTPGKNWNSLYTWDSGFISWAMNEIDPVKAFEMIRAYTTEDGSQSAFIHHGTPLPIQFFAFADLNNQLQDDKMLKFIYPRLRRFYYFMAGHDETSTTRMPSGLLKTWDYFYNSGGWDDYPPQHYLTMNTKLYKTVAPIVTTSFYLRAAKIMRMFASKLGKKNDVKMYNNDINIFTKAIQENAWDEESGYFGYVRHDDNGSPKSILRYSDGSNFNKGLDGISPFVAGICNETQKEKIIDNIFSSNKLWSDVGISTVDQSASYYNPSGYWNGCVWFPHQYIIWKSLLDNNLVEQAHKVAFTALDNWTKENKSSYFCFEHFIISSKRGAGWHNFSGLSSPIINWFNNYFKVGHISTGFDVMLSDTQFSDDKSSLEAIISLESSTNSTFTALLVCMNPDYDYVAYANGKKIDVFSPYKGLMYISVPTNKKNLRLTVKRK